ncbi:Serine/threonine protein kinase [uncultured Mycobacterium sp.]|uniref:non-specific serine/threonine protein kinase n=1 Tax=uncultured Mycobacterium sp. TaxID=171292 RepID=A0A1Y5P1G7_9MYCO|nr:Serine/threonine protein kinase [uncultured Mycobacterium sp.]
MDPKPASVGGYQIQSVLGTGGMGTVYLARAGAQVVALKVFDSGQPFTSALVHPNILPVYGHGETDDGKLWMAMQYVAGGDADSELRAGRMPSARAVKIIAGAAEALDFAHAQGVLHGDVKPSNFLIAEQDRVLLADFGTPPFAEHGVVLASAAYASPEMLRGKVIDERADIYSLGCSLFRLLTGKPPFFDAASKDEVVNCHLHDAAPQPTRFAPWLPAAMDDVVAKAMAKDPGQRYQSARALADEAAAAMR